MNPSDYEKIDELVDPSKIFDLSGQVGLITGGAGNMGRHFAEVLLRAGARIVLSDLNETYLKEAATELKNKTGQDVEIFHGDVSNEQSVTGLFQHVKQQLGRLDFYIHNVMNKPEGYYRKFSEYSIHTWNRVMESNLGGAFLCCREAVNLMKAQGGGSIVLTSSIYGIVGPDQRIYADCKKTNNPYDKGNALNLPGVYAASKGGLNAFAKYLATLVAGYRIRVNVLIPGGVYDYQDSSFHENYIDRTPLRRMAVWSDFNGAILFLVSAASRYMTGAELVIDGGWRAW